MSKHRKEWQDDGMAGIGTCGGERLAEQLVLTAPDGPMGGDEGDDYYAKTCPKCGARLVLRWAVRVEELPTEAA